jgi:hypothetical protein
VRGSFQNNERERVPRIAFQHKEEDNMVGLLERVWRQYFSAAHREGLQELKEVEKQTPIIADGLQAGEDLDQHDMLRLEELKDKLVTPFTCVSGQQLH